MPVLKHSQCHSGFQMACSVAPVACFYAYAPTFFLKIMLVAPASFFLGFKVHTSKIQIGSNFGVNAWI